MNEFLTQFHFLRPVWLLALIALIPLLWLLWRQHKQAGQWQNLIAPELLPFLLEGKTHRISPLRISLLALAWLVAVVALAGPSWQQLPVAVEKNQSAMVIVLDLSPSMLTEDIKPSRIVRARLKIADLLRERQDGQTALLVYAANAHVVTPLTDDVKTITNLLPLLTPAIMPASGSNTEEAVSRAITLLQDAGITSGDLLLITDGIEDEAQQTITEILSKQKAIRLSILGVGGNEPAPIPSRNGGFVRDRQNNIVTSFLNAAPLKNLAVDHGGRYKTLSNDATEMQLFNQLANPENNNQDKQSKKSDEFDQWSDAGYWLIFLLLPFIAFAFRRGMVLSLFLLPALLITPDNSYALGWDELWKNQDQLEYEKLKLRESNDKGLQAFRSGDYESAAKEFYNDSSATGRYNLGNALAKAGYLEEALAAYDQALAKKPDFQDAKKNRQLVEEALKKKQEEKKDKNQNQQDQKNQDQQQQNQNQSQGQQNSSDSQQNSSASNQDSQQQQQDSQTQSSTGQNTSAANEGSSSSSDSQSMQESLEKNQQAASSLASQAAMQSEQTSSSAASEFNQVQQAVPEDGLTDEERKQLEQWLRRVQDDPSGLLRKKFEYEHYKQRQQKMNGTWEAPANEADQRL